jgi:hypothetical protein
MRITWERVMSAREVLDGIKAWAAELDEPWSWLPELTMDDVIMHRVYDDDGHCVAECSSPDVAEFIAAAPTDIARLTAAVDAVLAECDYLDTLADGDKHYAAGFRKLIETALKDPS